MSRTCTICRHEKRDEIDSALVAGTPLRDIEGQYGTARSALHRHKAHVLAAMAEAQAARKDQETTRAEALVHEVEARKEQADDLLVQLRALQAKTVGILLAAESAGDLRAALIGIRAARENVELLARLAGELRDGTQVNVLVIPQWMSVRTALLDALQPYPEARVKAAEVLRRLGDGNGA